MQFHRSFAFCTTMDERTRQEYALELLDMRHLSASGIVDLLASHWVGIMSEDASSLKETIVFLRETDVPKDLIKAFLALKLQEFCYKKSAQRGIILGATVEVCGMRALISYDDADRVKARHVQMPKLVNTSLISNLKFELECSTRNGQPVIIVEGPSGTGKTVALLSQGRHATFVVYILPKEDEIGDVALASQNESERFHAVLHFMVRKLKQAVHREALVAMSRVDEFSSIRLLVALDDMGPFTLAVCMMRCIGGRSVRDALEADIGRKFPNVRFVLCAAGKGIGARNDSLTTHMQRFIYDHDYRYMAAPGRSDSSSARDENFEMFFSHFPRLTEMDRAKVRKGLSELFFAAVSENARMAAILGTNMSSSLDGAFDLQCVRWLCTLDVRFFLGPVFFRFAALSSIQRISGEAWWKLLVKAVRLHFFPYAHTADARAFEVHGMVSSCTLGNMHHACYTIDGWSPIALPFSSVALLSSVLGLNHSITRSVAGRATPVEHTLATLDMVACAACDEELFMLALDYNGGPMAPLWDMGFKGDQRACVASIDDKFRRKMHLPPSAAHDKTLHSLIHNMSRGGEEDGKAIGDVSGYLDEMRCVLLPFGEAFRGSSARGDLLPVAAFQNPDRAVPCGDIVLLIGRSAFILRVLEGQLAGVKVEGELRGMGLRWQQSVAGRRDAMPRVRKTRESPRAALGGILQVWQESTGLAVTDVHMCIVGPTAASAGESHRSYERWLASAAHTKEDWGGTVVFCDESVAPAAIVDSKIRFISIEHIKFMRFDTSGRRRSMPLEFNKPSLMSLTMEVPPAEPVIPRKASAKRASKRE